MTMRCKEVLKVSETIRPAAGVVRERENGAPATKSIRMDDFRPTPMCSPTSNASNFVAGLVLSDLPA
jgi:hypothetical protein